MHRWLLSLALTLFFVPAAAPVVFAAAPGLNYTCSDDGTNRATCSCEGVIDCSIMRADGVCKVDTRSCTAAGCTCDWKQAVVTKPKGPKSGPIISKIPSSAKVAP